MKNDQAIQATLVGGGGGNSNKSKQDIIDDLKRRVDDDILEPTNFDILKKLVENADSLDEAIKIAELGTTYKRTGFHFDKRLEKQSDTISYLKKNNDLSFETDEKTITHKLIVGDNYPGLLNLLVGYKGKIDVVYIDPPYAKDNMGEFAKTNYDNAITRDNLLSMLYPRLYVARQLLSENGAIFCSIDDRNHAYVKCLFDEIFDERNFVASVVWKSKRGRDNSARWFSKSHEYLLVYAKCIDNFNTNNLELNEETKEAYRNPDNDHRGNYRMLAVWARGTQGGVKYAFTSKNGQHFDERLWLFSEENLRKLDEDDKLIFKGDNVYRKMFLYENKGRIPETIWDNVSNAANAADEIKSIFGSIIFDTPKPVPYIEEILKVASNESSIVLDFFAGSGTTGQAVLKLNKDDNGKRKFVLVTNNEITDLSPNGIAIDVTSKRLKRVMTGKCYDGTGDFDWIKKNSSLGGNLEVLDIESVSNFEALEGKTPFDVIDETLYGCEKFSSIKEKIEWVCDNFEITQRILE